MFSHYDKEVANETISGFFGINVDGNFLMLTDKEPTGVPGGFADGDFIIYYCDPTKYTQIDTPDDYKMDVAGVKVYGVVAAVDSANPEKGTLCLKTASDFNITTSGSSDWEDFETYYYISEQFPDDDGPKELLKAFPDTVITPDFNIDSSDKVNCIAELNRILVDSGRVGKILAKYEIKLEGEEKEIFNEYASTTQSYDAKQRSGIIAKYLALVRPYIDAFYDDSPDGQTEEGDSAR